jgi:hypothetical protein
MLWQQRSERLASQQSARQPSAQQSERPQSVSQPSAERPQSDDASSETKILRREERIPWRRRCSKQREDLLFSLIFLKYSHLSIDTVVARDDRHFTRAYPTNSLGDVVTK